MSDKPKFRTCSVCGRRLADANKEDKCFFHSGVTQPLFSSDEPRLFAGALNTEMLGAPRIVQSSKVRSR
jgi:hypothetical protein